MAINGEPYVHSNYYNFLHNLGFDPFEKTKTVTNRAEVEVKIQKRFTQQVNELEQIRNALKKEADDFLGVDTKNITPREIFNQLNSGRQKIIEVAKKIIFSPEFAKIIRDSAIISIPENAADNFFTTVADGYAEQKKDSISIDEAIEKIAEQIVTVGHKAKDDGKNIQVVQNNKFQRIFKGYIKRNEIQLKKKDVYTDDSQALRRLIRKAIQKSGLNQNGNKQNNKTMIENLQTYFINEFNKKFEGITVNNEDEEFKNTFIKEVTESFNKLDSSRYINEANISGDITEIAQSGVIVSLFRANGGNIGLEIIGSKKENEVQELQRSLDEAATANAQRTVKGLDKQSYSDWILTKKEGDKIVKTARVQVKNYRPAIQSWIEKGDLEKGAGATIRLLSQEKDDKVLVTDFIEKMEKYSTKDTLDSKNFFYALANEIWFDAQGTISPGKKEKNSTFTRFGKSKKVNKSEEHVFNDALVNDYVTSVYLNYLGVVISKSGADEEQKLADIKASNIFYYVLGEAIIPTWIIVDGLMQAIEDQNKDALMNLRIKFDAPTSFPITKEEFRVKKEEAVGGLIRGMDYSDSRLVKVGADEGQEILKDSYVTGVIMQLDAKNLYQSGYLFNIADKKVQSMIG